MILEIVLCMAGYKLPVDKHAVTDVQAMGIYSVGVKMK